MNKEQAITALKKGSKITHKRFIKGEYIMEHPKSHEHYTDEYGNVLSIKVFWQYRTAKSWQEDWTIFKKR